MARAQGLSDVQRAFEVSIGLFEMVLIDKDKREVMKTSCSVSMHGTYSLFANGNGTLLIDSCTSKIALYAKDIRKAVEALCCKWVIMSEASLADCSWNLWAR
jgi:hypothetical protein